jgi:hypothetical protein
MIDTIRAPSSPGLRHTLRVGLLLASLLLWGRTSAAELVVLRGGNVLKVESYEIDGPQVILELPTGGRLVLPLLRVERVVEDEIVDEPEPLPETVYPLRFAAGHQVPETPFGELIFAAARRHDLNPQLVAALIGAESAFDPQAVSAKGARGLMQLMPATAVRFGVADAELFDPERNLEAGTSYLDWLTDRFAGKLPLVLAAYNAGEGIVARFGGVPPYRETLGYLQRIYASLGLESPPPAKSAGR